MKDCLRSNLAAIVGILVCAWSAALLSMVFHHSTSKVMVPILFIAVVILVSVRCGVWSGLVGSAIATLIFAVFLFPPLGSPEVSNKSARANLAWLILGGLTSSYLLGSTAKNRSRRN